MRRFFQTKTSYTDRFSNKYHIYDALFDLILYVPVNIFQFCWDGSSCDELVLSKD